MSLHRCTEADCPFVGQRTNRGCMCHQTDEQVLTAKVAALTGALEWALDQAAAEHPHYPMRSEAGGWEYPYLVHGSPMGGGVGTANFGTALEAVESARAASPPSAQPTKEQEG